MGEGLTKKDPWEKAHRRRSVGEDPHEKVQRMAAREGPL